MERASTILSLKFSNFRRSWAFHCRVAEEIRAKRYREFPDRELNGESIPLIGSRIDYLFITTSSRYT